MVEGVFSRAFKTGVRPVELGRRMLREMDEHRSIDVHGRRIVPNQFAFFLSPTDAAAFDGISDALVAELVESAQDYAAQEGYFFMGLVTIDLVERPDIKPGRFTVISQMREDVGPRGRPGQTRPGEHDDYGQGWSHDPGAAYDPDADETVVESPWAPIGSGSRVTPAPQPTPAVQRAQPHLTLDNGERILLGAQPAVIGRLAGCAVVVSDLNVSRRHAQVRRNGGVFLVTDLGSTNGTLVNDVHIDGEVVLHDGDVISVGATHLRFGAS